MKKTALLFCTIVFCYNTNAQFSISYNKTTGAIKAIVNSKDAPKMNWVLSSSDSIPTWQKPPQDWGMGKYSVASKKEIWSKPSILKISNNDSRAIYKTAHLDVAVKRIITGIFFTETYQFKNTTDEILQVDSLSIYTPYNDNYPNARTSVTQRCNAHIWAGLNSSYVNAVMMGGTAPHLGLVFTKGAMKSYSVENRGIDGGGEYNSSNTRGTLILNMPAITLKPNEIYTVQWKLFWHDGWQQFYTIAKTLRFVRIDATKYVIKQNEQATINIDASKSTGITSNIQKLPSYQLGERSFTVSYAGNKQTIINYLVVSSQENIIDRRIHFIVDHQQMNDTNDLRFGAYMVFDNDTDTILTNPQGYISPADKDEGAERNGMGLFIAAWLKTHKNEAVKQSLLRYIYFLRNKLQTPDYKVFSNATKTSRHRGYNYPWIANLYLQMYHLSGEVAYLKDYYGTLSRFYKEFGYEFYGIGIPVKDGLDALKKEGLINEHDSLQINFKKMGDHFIKNSIYYPKSEVNYEQSIVAPAIIFLLELYNVTHEQKYLEESKRQMPLLEAFSGRQPDVHLNDIAIRHWDGYWFGKSKSWGDVMPHYWSTLTADAFQHYSQTTRDEGYNKRAMIIVENNLLNFKEDGRASCAYIYPLTVNGKPGKFYDAFANDQDFALYYYLKLKSAL